MNFSWIAATGNELNRHKLRRQRYERPPISCLYDETEILFKDEIYPAY